MTFPQAIGKALDYNVTAKVAGRNAKVLKGPARNRSVKSNYAGLAGAFFKER
jgi:hypothetical protein